MLLPISYNELDSRYGATYMCTHSIIVYNMIIQDLLDIKNRLGRYKTITKIYESFPLACNTHFKQAPLPL